MVVPVHIQRTPKETFAQPFDLVVKTRTSAVAMQTRKPISWAIPTLHLIDGLPSLAVVFHHIRRILVAIGVVQATIRRFRPN